MNKQVNIEFTPEAKASFNLGRRAMAKHLQSGWRWVSTMPVSRRATPQGAAWRKGQRAGARREAVQAGVDQQAQRRVRMSDPETREKLVRQERAVRNEKKRARAGSARA